VSGTGASRGNSLLSTTANADHVGQLGSSSSATASAGDNADCDYIMMEDLFEDMASDDDGGRDADEEAIVRDPKGAELLEEIANRLDEDDILFGTRGG